MIISDHLRHPNKRLLALSLIAIGLLSFYLNTFNNTFPHRYHPDERKKIRFVDKGKQDFQHPILMIQANRICNIVLKYDRHKHIMMLGRRVNAMFGVIAVICSFFIARKIMPPGMALLASASVAVCPILVVHCHYFKEDAPLVGMMMLALWTFLNLLEKPCWQRAVASGVTAGLTASAHYKGFLLLPFFIIMPAIIDRARNKKYFVQLAIIIASAIVVFLLVNYPMLQDFSNFKKGINWSTTQATKGHHLKIYPLDHAFMFHLKNSLLPGMTWLPLLCGLAACAYTLWRFKKTDWPVRIIVASAIAFYLAVEISPMKDFPGFIRYALPVAPLLIIIGWKGLELYTTTRLHARCNFAALIVAIGLIALPAYSSSRLVWNMLNETRDQVARRFNNNNSGFFETYAGKYRDTNRLIDAQDITMLRNKGYRYLIASSFMYERYYYGRKLKDQHVDIYGAADAYDNVFQYPYEEVKPAYKTFALSNPVLRIIDIGEK